MHSSSHWGAGRRTPGAGAGRLFFVCSQLSQRHRRPYVLTGNFERCSHSRPVLFFWLRIFESSCLLPTQAHCTSKHDHISSRPPLITCQTLVGAFFCVARGLEPPERPQQAPKDFSGLDARKGHFHFIGDSRGLVWYSCGLA